MSINIAAYSEEFRVKAAKLQDEFRAEVRGQFGRELNETEEAQGRTVDMQLAMTLFLIAEQDLGTSPDAVVKAFAIACSVGLQNIATQGGLNLADCADVFGKFMLAALQSSAHGGAFETEISAKPFEQQ